MTIDQALQKYFGHSEFREGQRDVMLSLMDSRSALAIFPTGGGKSLCYQLPALLFDGLTLVVSPLIALMKDQVETLTSRGLSAARLDSTLSSEEVQDIYKRMESGDLKLLYVAPERLANEGFLKRLRRCPISMLAVDEAHCISEWGHNFRPDYLKLAQQAKELKVGRVLALTATATPPVAADIRKRFGIAEKDHIQTGFARPELIYRVTPCRADDRKARLLSQLKKQKKGPTIVYVTLQRTAEEVAGFLSQNGLSAGAYHAGMKDEHRAEMQDRFMTGDMDIVVATIAFGMGIDKADIRYVYHYNLPKSLENFVQESGRAGRDGEAAFCEILACLDDLTVLENFVYGDTPSPTALQSVVEHVLMQGEEFSVSRYQLSGAKDIRPIVIATALTYLELDGVISPTGPFYSGYQYQLLRSEEQGLAGHSEERKQFLRKIFSASDKGWKWYKLPDLENTAKQINEDANRIRKGLGYLADMGEIILKPNGLRHGYKLVKGADLTISKWTERLVKLFETRESGEIARLGKVVELCESKTCVPEQLLNYFGDKMDEPCGKCSSCTDNATDNQLPRQRKNDTGLTSEQAAIIYELHREEHVALRQPRQLARYLCGITSPAASRARLNRDDRFGALGEVPFQEVLLHAEAMLPLAG